ncbi:MAG: hypothetical protein FWF00_00775 [Endomicrobia bacterium]|nr:hypothetical protein [Endomicrobiia bacterium]MCL2506210.1 hypothetical protein [Endomicrobiia bacterium]
MKKVLSLFVAVSFLCSFAGLPGQVRPAFAGQTIIIDGLPIANSVYGNGSLPNGYWDGISALADPNSNTVRIVNGSVVNWSVYGGGSYSTSGSVAANHNSVIIDNSSARSAYGGRADSNSNSAEANHNSVNIANGSTVSNYVYGGDAYSLSGLAEANTNSVKIDSSAGSDYVYGGQAYSASGSSAEANTNSVSINSSTVGSYVYGGQASNGSGSAEANTNSVDITNGSEVGWNVSGGQASCTSGSAKANANSVNITNGSMMDHLVTGGNAHSLSGSAEANSNSVNIANGVTVSYTVTGGDARSNNAGSATANANSVIINGGTVNGFVLGGYADSNGAGALTEANYNTVNISNSKIAGNIYGGISIVGNATGIGEATHNTVTLGSGANADLTASFIYGGFVVDGMFTPIPLMDARTGNTLNVRSELTVKGIYNFENLNFYIPASMGNGGTMLIVDNAVNITNSKIGVCVDAPRSSVSAINVGDTVTLIDATAGGLIATGVNTTALGVEGVSKIFEFELDYSDGLNLFATVTSEIYNPQPKALSEGQLAGLAFLNQASDFISNYGISSLMQAAGSAESTTIFAAMGGGWSEYKTGSNVKVSGFSVMAGLAKKMNEKITAGAFVEGGWGNYDSFNSFNSVASVDGNGSTNYYGLGFLGHYNISDAWYGEGSLRAGSTKTDFNSADFIGYSNVNYETSAIYYGAHIGAGWLHKLNDKLGLDVSGKLFYTSQGADSVAIEGDKVEFDAANSMRTRIGGRLNCEIKSGFAPYASAYLDYEFNGKAQARIYGADIDAPELKGATGIGELGISVNVSEALTLDIGLQGYGGIRQGGSGSLQAIYKF